MDYKELTGRENKNLYLWDASNQLRIHSGMVESLKGLQDAAKSEGFSLQVASGFRDYERQLAIWNAKASGKRKLLDRHEKEVDFDSGDRESILEAILTWSAIPGASRHHWGTEIDIFDASTKERSELKLTQRECQEDFAEFYTWLNENLHRFPFHRPYQNDLGGVAQEPWHLSYTPLSTSFEKNYTIETFRRNLEESNLLLKESLVAKAEEVFERFVANTTPAR